MRWRYILHTIAIMCFFFGLTMMLPLIVSLYYRDQSVMPILKSMAITVVSGLVLHFVFKGGKAEVISQREGMAIVAIGWTAVGLFGALPFYFDSGFERFVDAAFESVSGFTTTGASILTNI